MWGLILLPVSPHPTYVIVIPVLFLILLKITSFNFVYNRKKGYISYSIKKLINFIISFLIKKLFFSLNYHFLKFAIKHEKVSCFINWRIFWKQ